MAGRETQGALRRHIGDRLTGRGRRVGALALAGLLVLAVAACWLPDRFLAEIRVARDGSYASIYKGDLVWVPLVKEIRAGTLTDAEVVEKMAVLERDLRRDSAFTTVEAVQPGRFRVYYETSGRLDERAEFIFLRRNNAVITLERDGTSLTVRGAVLNAQQKAQIRDAGLSFGGRFRVVSNARPVRGNPARSGSRGYEDYRVYDWTVAGPGGEPPVIAFDLSRPP